jgi:hypothetical protein
MLRDSKLRFDRVSPAARLGTMAIVFACGLLVAGLRGPRSNQALADEPEKSAVAADNCIDTTFLTDNAQIVAIMRPAEFFAKPEMKGWGTIFEEPGGLIPQGLQCADIRQVVGIVPEMKVRSGPEGLRVIQFVKSDAEGYLKKRLQAKHKAGKEYEGKKSYIIGTHSLMQFDEFTILEASGVEALDAYMAGKRGVLPQWMPKNFWESFQNDQMLFAANAATVRLFMKDIKNAPSNVQAAFFSVSPLWEETDWLALGVKSQERLEIHACAAAMNAEALANLQKTLEAGKTLAENLVKNARSEGKSNPAMNPTFGIAELLLSNLKIQQKDNALLAETSIEFAKLQVLAPSISAARNAARRMQSANNLKMIALAMMNYVDSRKMFPSAVFYDKTSKIPYSWRVAILPFIERKDLYDQYRFDEPWDGPNNIKLLDKMPSFYRDPNDAPDSKNASYFVLTGPGTVFDGDKGTQPREIVDGMSNTILVVQAKRDIPWTKPEDIPYDAEKPLPKLGGFYEGVFLAALCDGSVHVLQETIDEKIKRLLITKADKQPVQIPGEGR